METCSEVLPGELAIEETTNPFDLLNDDMVVTVGEHLGQLCGPTEFVRFAQTTRRFQRLFIPGPFASEEDNRNVVANVICARAQIIFQSSEPTLFPPTNEWSLALPTLQHLSLFERWCGSRFCRDNRFCFEFASVALQSNHIKHISEILKIMDTYPTVRVRLDAHCGIAAPDGIAGRFSQHRGDAVLHAIHAGSNHDGRLTVVPWGKRISILAASSNHPFSEVAREGRGSVEVTFQMDGASADQLVLLPPRPSYYLPESEEETIAPEGSDGSWHSDDQDDDDGNSTHDDGL